MKLNHINLCTSDVDTLRTLLVTHFGYAVVQAGQIPADVKTADAGTRFAMLDGQDGSSLVLTQIVPPGPMSYPTNFHFGIGLASPGEVHAKRQELVEAGHHPDDVKSFDAVGSHWTSFTCPLSDGMKIEINHRSPAPANAAA